MAARTLKEFFTAFAEAEAVERRDSGLLTPESREALYLKLKKQPASL